MAYDNNGNGNRRHNHRRQSSWSNGHDRDSSSAPAPASQTIADLLSSPQYRDADPDSGEIPLAQLDEFVIPANDERGHGEHVHFRLPGYLLHAIKVLIGSGRFPYLNVGYFIRHAVLRHVHYLAGLRSSISQHVVPSLDAAMEVCRDDEMRILAEKAFLKIEERVQSHMARGDHGEVVRLLNLVRGKLEVAGGMSQRQREIYKHFEQYWSQYLYGSGPVLVAGAGARVDGEATAVTVYDVESMTPVSEVEQ